MPAEVPLIYSPLVVRETTIFAGRAVAAAVSVACLAVLITALHLHPNPSGMGTHLDLGLQPCWFLEHTGLPCPSCGMTTSFAWFARGNIVASFYIQPMGAVLAALTVVAFWSGLYIAITGRPAHRLLLFVRARYYLVPLMGWALFAWSWKIFIHIRGIDGWH